MTIARNYLSRDRLRREPHGLGYMLLHERIDLRESAYRTRDRAGRDFLAGGDQALAGAGEFGVGVSKLQSERHRLGMDAVGTTDRRRHLVLKGALLQRSQHIVDILDQQV